MVRRLLLVLAGLGAAAVAAVLWSGTAYASTPHGLTVPPVRVPASPSAPALALPVPQVPAHATTSSNEKHAPVPVSVPHVVQRAIGIVAPVVDRTVHTVQTVAPVSRPLVSTPEPVHALAHEHAVRPARHAQPAASRRTRTFSASGNAHAAVATRVASSTHARTKSPAVPRHHAPLGDLSDGANRAPQTANGTPFAVTRASHHPAGARGSRPACETLRDPGAIPLRDIARPG